MNDARDALKAAIAHACPDVMPQVDMLLAAHAAETLRDAAYAIEREEADKYPGPILGAIKRMRAAYFSAKLRHMAQEAQPTP
ncbi:hypothetical protein ACFW81_24145 [Streptomyces angustmyceticus]|uniref:hypothetical protein n=1 Tax=Streptomyces angustmyceticus TaxID=285578 RepID=UPI003674A252